MNEFLQVLALAAMPAAGNFLGGALAEAIRVSQRTLSLALHAAAGVVLAIVGVELMPQALAIERPWISILAFVAGGGFFVLLDQGIGLIRTRAGKSATEAGPWLIFAGVAIDLFSDGLMIGTGATLSLGLALLLALGQIPADVPEGFVTIASLKDEIRSRRTRLLLSASFAIPVLLGATLGYWAVRGQPEFVKMALLAFTAGVLTTVVVEEIVPEAHEDGEARFAALVFVAGFAVFAFISTYFE